MNEFTSILVKNLKKKLGEKLNNRKVDKNIIS